MSRTLTFLVLLLLGCGVHKHSTRGVSVDPAPIASTPIAADEKPVHQSVVDMRIEPGTRVQSAFRIDGKATTTWTPATAPQPLLVMAEIFQTAISQEVPVFQQGESLGSFLEQKHRPWSSVHQRAVTDLVDASEGLSEKPEDQLPYVLMLWELHERKRAAIDALPTRTVEGPLYDNFVINISLSEGRRMSCVEHANALGGDFQSWASHCTALHTRLVSWVDRLPPDAVYKVLPQRLHQFRTPMTARSSRTSTNKPAKGKPPSRPTKVKSPSRPTKEVTDPWKKNSRVLDPWGD